ncbi:peptidoglycan-binding protein [Actinotalea ferrariae]|uniref:peptidoglycan-binding domain-containing protein n=1 Tax=Actinotalea ferrariae TaxID=1386098 RepID=UPI001C8B7F91|nr:peptidoglycan-binding domain-containing protein [Actinotalea ferrariae]MBX9246714.1 peptidoglycan-binding protein [Actinotalea ferrariae]
MADTSPLRSDTPAAPVITNVEPGKQDGRQTVTVTVEHGQARSVTSTTDGVVTQVDLVAGQSVADGAPAFVADGSPVTVYVAEAPMYRDLTSGTSGDDVRDVQSFLQRLGYDVAPDGRLGPDTARAIRAFNRDRGRPQDEDVLRRDSVLWVAPASTVPQAVHLRVGDPVSDGSEVYLPVSTTRLVVSTDPVDAQRTLRVADVEVLLAAGRNVVDDPGAVSVVVGALGDEVSSTATVQLTEPEVVGLVPATAVVTDPHGVTCMWPSSTSAPTVLTDVTGIWGTVHVPVNLIGTEVLVNPRQVREDLSCGS